MVAHGGSTCSEAGLSQKEGLIEGLSITVLTNFRLIFHFAQNCLNFHMWPLVREHCSEAKISRRHHFMSPSKRTESKEAEQQMLWVKKKQSNVL